MGSAVPTPDWSDYEASSAGIPTQCANGTTGTVFSNSAPGVVVFDPRYQQARSVRGNLQWNGAVLNNILITQVDYTQSLNLNQAEFANINFVPNTALHAWRTKAIGRSMPDRRRHRVDDRSGRAR